jgi:hypothetical protein
LGEFSDFSQGTSLPAGVEKFAGEIAGQFGAAGQKVLILGLPGDASRTVAEVDSRALGNNQE